MSYHDSKLLKAAARRNASRPRAFRSALRGIREMTLTPSSPSFEFGSVASDWRAVGAGLRTAMERARFGE
ncbi:hypothetical protein [Novosphingobium sp.]|uniref:hypothetical protein n=1 Tax=Novosphingobium sp. TaxID=1874826 RepID=UPI00261FB631|nr:hypothetical protein [Novosphingobium sp.]